MILKHLYFISFVLVLSSCQKDETQTNILNVNDEIEIHLSQKPAGSQINPSFIVSTIDSVSCTNSELVVQSNLDNHTFNLNILGVWVFGSCNPGQTKPISETGFLYASDEYVLKMTLKNSLTSTGKLTVTKDEICIFMEKTAGISIENQCINRISQGGVWGYITSHNDQQRAAINNFITQNAKSAFAPIFGNYGLFILDDNQHVRLQKSAQPTAEKGQYISRYFVVDNWDVFVQKLSEFLNGFQDYSIRLTNFEGSVFER